MASDNLQTGLGFRYSMLSDEGRVRHGNEDWCAAALGQGIFVVCDGMGGAAAGEVASELAATTFVEYLQAHTRRVDGGVLQAAVQAANTAVHDHSRQRSTLRGMGTTLVALLLEPAVEDDGRTLWLTHVGDSRCYRLRAGRLLLLTRDHSLVEEQIMAGQLSPEEAEFSPVRNVITRAVGSSPEVEAEVRQLAAEPGDLFLLCSDGLTRELSDTIIEGLLDAFPASLDDLCRTLVDATNAAGGHDNVSVLLLGVDA